MVHGPWLVRGVGASRRIGLDCIGDADLAETSERGADPLRVAQRVCRATPKKHLAFVLLRSSPSHPSCRSSNLSGPAGRDGLSRRSRLNGLRRVPSWRRRKLAGTPPPQEASFLGLARGAPCATRSGSAPRSPVSAKSASPIQSNPIRRDALTPRTNHGPWTMDHGPRTPQCRPTKSATTVIGHWMIANHKDQPERFRAMRRSSAAMKSQPSIR
jgi:hypothetical protein